MVGVSLVDLPILIGGTCLAKAFEPSNAAIAPRAGPARIPHFHWQALPAANPDCLYPQPGVALGLTIHYHAIA
ncbi:MAG: hypothetical protein KDF64_15230 [Geminicoccaceae bacterium]|nr:hypothetical protein [Geminicoccaceae bacterium]